jgi:hypothetical protein
MAQIARNLTDAVAGPLRGYSHLIVDRVPLHTAHVQSLLEVAGVSLLRLPPRSPNLNAYAERFVRSLKEECLRHVVPLGERHLRTVIREFVEHYHSERNHQGLGNVIPFPSAVPSSCGGIPAHGARSRRAKHARSPTAQRWQGLVTSTRRWPSPPLLEGRVNCRTSSSPRQGERTDFPSSESRCPGRRR